MIAYRICKERYADRDSVLSGEGARIEGGRWNRPGLPLVYASENRSLAVLEILARTDLEDLPEHLVLVAVTIPDDASITRIEKHALPPDWQEPGNAACIRLGSNWIESGEGLILRVPSATNPYEENILLNPGHEDIARCTIGLPTKVIYDPRIQSLFSQLRAAAD